MKVYHWNLLSINQAGNNHYQGSSSFEIISIEIGLEKSRESGEKDL